MTFYKDFGDGWGTPSYSIEVQGETPAYLGVTWDLIGQLRNNIFSDWVFDQLPLIDRRDTAFPVGDRTLPTVVEPRSSIPQLVPEVVRTPTSEVFDPIIEGFPVVPLSDADWLIKMGLPPARVANTLFIEQKEETDVGVFSDIYDTVDVLSGGWLPGGPVDPWDNPGVLNFPTTTTPAPIPPPGPSVVRVGPDGSTMPGQFQVGGSCEQGPYPVWKRVCGQYKWVMPKRRRRKQLATKGDIKSLAALKGVIGGGKSLDTWIATHS